MSTSTLCKQKAEAGPELVRVRSGQLKAQARISSADAAIAFSNEIGILENTTNSPQVTCKDVIAGNETPWEHFKEGADRAWSTLTVPVDNSAARFQK